MKTLRKKLENLYIHCEEKIIRCDPEADNLPNLFAVAINLLSQIDSIPEEIVEPTDNSNEMKIIHSNLDKIRG